MFVPRFFSFIKSAVVSVLISGNTMSGVRTTVRIEEVISIHLENL